MTEEAENTIAGICMDLAKTGRTLTELRHASVDVQNEKLTSAAKKKLVATIIVRIEQQKAELDKIIKVIAAESKFL